MSDDEHPELDFDPLDDTKTWPEDAFPLRPVGRMVLDRNVTNHFAENEQVAFGTGVLVDGLDFCDDKMLVGRTFSLLGHPALPRRPELPAAAGQRAARRPPRPTSATARWRTTWTATGENPHVNYEPSSTGGLAEAEPPARSTGPYVAGHVGRQKLERTNDYAQAGERYRTMPDWERDDLVLNLVDLLGQCERPDPGADGRPLRPAATRSSAAASPRGSECRYRWPPADQARGTEVAPGGGATSCTRERARRRHGATRLAVTAPRSEATAPTQKAVV